MISQSAVGGKLDPGEAGMLSGVFHLHEQEAREVMTPIPAVVTVDYSSNVSTPSTSASPRATTAWWWWRTATRTGCAASSMRSAWSA